MIPWCDRRRAYCASGCSVAQNTTNSGLCDWESKIRHVQYVARPETEGQQRPQQPGPRQQPRHPQQSPRSRFGKNRHPGPRREEHNGEQNRPPVPVEVQPAATAPAEPVAVAPTQAELIPESSSE